jgi:ankyrin repeat protein
VYRLWWEIYSTIYYSKGRDFRTSLRVACYFRHIAVAKRSLKRDTDIDAQDGGYGNALHETSRRGHEQVMRLLLDKGADVNVQGGYYGNALPGGFTTRL